jgi:hypothetical protein
MLQTISMQSVVNYRQREGHYFGFQSLNVWKSWEKSEISEGPPVNLTHYLNACSCLVTALATCGHAAAPPSADLHALPSACMPWCRALPCLALLCLDEMLVCHLLLPLHALLLCHYLPHASAAALLLACRCRRWLCCCCCSPSCHGCLLCCAAACTAARLLYRYHQSTPRSPRLSRW